MNHLEFRPKGRGINPTRGIKLVEIQPNQAKLVTAWLVLGLSALIASGIFSILLVVSRTPGIQDHIPLIDSFYTALVAHVVLSVLIWFLSFSSVFWSLSSSRVFLIDWLAWGLAALGTFIVVIAPFLGDTNPLINNYVPVLQQPQFLTGLGLFAAGCSIRILTHLVSTSLGSILGAGTWFAALISMLAFVSVIWTFFIIPAEADGALFYEYLFWGGGHIIQFSYTVLMLLGWYLLSKVTISQPYQHERLLQILIVLAGAPALYSIFILFKDFHAQRIAFTQLMISGGLTSIPAGLFLLLKCPWKKYSVNPYSGLYPGARASLLSSIVLFAVGGVFAFMIHGMNVVIPAHYHGSIVGVTLAFFGVTYYLLPTLGYSITLPRLASVQPYIYAVGQLMHIMGLAWSGGYGVKRKTAGAEQGLEQFPEIAGMALMGAGGLVAIIGGIIFLVIALASLLRGKR